MRGLRIWPKGAQLILIFLLALWFIACSILQVDIKKTLTPPVHEKLTPTESTSPTLQTPMPELPLISVENVSQLRPLAEVKEVADYSLRWDKHVGEVIFIKEKLFIESINQTIVWQWDAATRQLLFGHTLPTQDVIAISPDGKTLATENDQDFSIQLWDTNTGQQLRQFEREAYPPLRATGMITETNGLTFSPDGKILVVSDVRESIDGRANYIRLWDIETGRLLGQRKVSDTREFHISVKEFLTQDTILINHIGFGGCYAGHGGGSSRLQLWQVNDLLSADGQMPQWSTAWGPACPDQIISSLNRKIMGARFRDFEKVFALVWDTETGATRTWFDEGQPISVLDIQALALNPMGTIVAASKSDGVFGLWHTDTTTLGQVRWQPTPKPFYLFSSAKEETPTITSLAYNIDGRLLVAGTDEGHIQLWEAITHQLLHTLKGHQGRVTSIKFSGDNHLLISQGQDGSVRLWGIQIP